MSIKEDVVSKIKNYNIFNTISFYIKLHKHGANQYKGKCPFHKEKTASFFEDSKEGYYKCFGCNKGGDVINFVQEIEKIEFKDAVRKICQIIGIEYQISEVFVNKEKKNKLETLSVLNNKIADFFHSQIFLEKNKEILDYLIYIRKLDLKTIKKFKIGYCDEKDFFEFVNNNSISEGSLVELSILKIFKSSNFINKNLFFKDRIMIPIVDKKGNVISFGGRIFKEANNYLDKVKYLNGSNNMLFQKGEMLFNINNIANKNFTLPEKQNQFLFVVEGYLDSIMLDKFGFNAVASLGTGLTTNQLGKIFDITKEPYFCYDSDVAGKTAMFNICKKICDILKAGYTPKFILLQKAKDVDEFLNNFGIDEFKKYIQNSSEYFEYVFDFIYQKYNVQNPNEKSLFEKDIEEFFQNIPDKKLSKNYINYARNKLFELTKINKKSLLNNKNNKSEPLNLNAKTLNILVKKLASFLCQNPEFKNNEDLFKILNNKEEDFKFILDIVNNKISLDSIKKIKFLFSFEGDKKIIFTSLIDAIRLNDISSKKDKNLKNKITRKTILDNKLNIINE